MLTGQSCPGLMQITIAAGKSMGAMAVFRPPDIVLLHISWFFYSLSSLWRSLSHGGCVTALLFRTPHSTIVYFLALWPLLWASALTSMWATFSFFPLPSPLSPSSSSIPSSLFSLHVEARGWCVCLPLYLSTLLFNLKHYLLLCAWMTVLWKKLHPLAPTDPSAVNWLNCHWLWRVWNVTIPESNHLRPFSAFWIAIYGPPLWVTIR